MHAYLPSNVWGDNSDDITEKAKRNEDRVKDKKPRKENKLLSLLNLTNFLEA